MAINVENLTKSYGAQKAVNDISFQINTGEVVGFLGPNGAGKSTTMKMITCFLAAETGTIRMGKFTVERQPEEFKKRIGYLPENNPLYTEMAIIDYLRFCAEMQRIPSDQISERIALMIDVCGLEQEKQKKIGQLSKGYRQRVGLAQAMIHDPEILVLDGIVMVAFWRCAMQHRHEGPARATLHLAQALVVYFGCGFARG